MPELIRKRQAAEWLGVSAPRISQLLRAGHLSEVAETKMLSRADVEAFAQCRAVHSHQRSPATAPEPPQRRAPGPVSPAIPEARREGLPSIAESRQRLEALKAAIAQHDLDTRNGKLVSREEVAQAAFQEGQRIRQALEGLPNRIGQGLAGALGRDAAQAGEVGGQLQAIHSAKKRKTDVSTCIHLTTGAAQIDCTAMALPVAIRSLEGWH